MLPASGQLSLGPVSRGLPSVPSTGAGQAGARCVGHKGGGRTLRPLAPCLLGGQTKHKGPRCHVERAALGVACGGGGREGGDKASFFLLCKEGASVSSRAPSSSKSRAVCNHGPRPQALPPKCGKSGKKPPLLRMQGPRSVSSPSQSRQPLLTGSSRKPLANQGPVKLNKL